MINIAVVGFGYWGPNLVRNIQEMKDACVVSCCDTNPQRLALAKSKHPSINITTDYEAVLKDPSIDAVVISTPVATHYKLARKALESGKHVLLEKPATNSASEAEKLICGAKRVGVGAVSESTVGAVAELLTALVTHSFW